MKTIFITLMALLIPLNTFAAEICDDSILLEMEISSLYPNPIEDEDEWIEIQNLSDFTLDLSFYTLEDETQHPWTLEGILAPGEKTKMTDPPFALNNGSDTVTLKTISGQELSSLNYDSSSPGQIIGFYAEPEIEAPLSWPDFSEAMPNPEGPDSSDEWIELYNPYEYSLLLDGLQLDDADGGSSPHSLTGEIPALSYFLISITDSGITLNNTSDSVRLLNDSKILWSIDYEDAVEGESLSYLDGIYVWTTPTPGEANQAPEGEQIDGDLSEDIELSEILPNPEGADGDNEWIEITNSGDESVNLSGWIIDDGEGGSEPYILPEGTIIEAGQTLVIPRSESKVALNNSNETVELKDYTNEIVDEISYEDSQEGKSYSKILVENTKSTLASASALGTKSNLTWHWVSPSPGAPNPSIKQMEGEVLSFESGTLKLFDGISTWELVSGSNSLNDIIFKPGNQIMVQAMANGKGIFEIFSSELLESTPVQESKQIPWGILGSGLLASLWLGYEWYKKRHEKHFPAPVSLK